MSPVSGEGAIQSTSAFTVGPKYSCSASGFTTRSDIGPAREGPSAEVIAYVQFPPQPSYCAQFICSEAQARRGEEAEVDPDQFQDPDNEYGLFAGTTYEQDDEEADKIYQQVDEAMDARRRARRCVSRLSGQSLSLLLTD
jgi:pre-mRNA-processing factor 6